MFNSYILFVGYMECIQRSLSISSTKWKYKRRLLEALTRSQRDHFLVKFLPILRSEHLTDGETLAPLAL